MLIIGNIPLCYRQSLQAHLPEREEILCLPNSKKLPVQTAYHADMRLLHIGDGQLAIDCSIPPQQREKLWQIGYVITFLQELGERYPQDTALNIALVGEHALFNPQTVPHPLQQLLCQKYQPVPVRQGYTRCSTAILGPQAIITADTGIAAAAAKVGISVLHIRPGHILLPGYDYGFIGGCVGRVGDTLYSTGSLDRHPDGQAMRAFIRAQQLKLVQLTDGPLRDIGGMIWLPNRTNYKK